jgi:glycosyltransferase involved in cell wall biosynthesis
LDDVQKARLLGSALGLLMPVEFEETFGLVMVEAMACGTPVVAFARGGISEVIQDGINGFLCRTVEEAVGAVGRLGQINRARVRANCEARFSDAAMVDAYEQLYRDLLS